LQELSCQNLWKALMGTFPTLSQLFHIPAKSYTATVRTKCGRQLDFFNIHRFLSKSSQLTLLHNPEYWEDPKDLKPWLSFPQILSELKIQKRHKVCWVIPFLNLWQYTLHTAVQRARLCSKTISWTDMNHVSHYCPIKKQSTLQKDSKYDKSPINLKIKKWK
jgi:hypothetical protein